MLNIAFSFFDRGLPEGRKPGMHANPNWQLLETGVGSGISRPTASKLNQMDYEIDYGF